MPTVTTLSQTTLSVDLGTRDFEGFRADVLDSGGLADLYAPDWTDRSELDLGVALVESFAYMADVLSYYLDRYANEALFSSIFQRRSMIEQCKLIGYELRPSVSATVDLTFVTTGSGTVQEGTSIEVDTSDGSEPATFELNADFVSTGAGTYTGILAIHGTTVEEVLGSSSGSAGQEYALSQRPLSLVSGGAGLYSSSLRVFVTEGMVTTEWGEVDNFLESGSTDEDYRIEIDEFDEVTVIFGDGVNGKVPASGTLNVSAIYRVGGGPAGNQVGENKLTKIVGSFAFVSSVTNPNAPSGGLSKETIEEAKENAPASLKALERGVNHADYRSLALEVPGVSKARAYRGAGAYEEYVVIAVGGSNPIPTGSWDPYTESGTGLIGDVGAYLTLKGSTPVLIKVYPAQLVDVYLAMTAYLFGNVRSSDVDRLLTSRINAVLNVENQQFGEQLPLSRIADTGEDTTGVDYVDIIRFQRVPYARWVRGGADPSFGSFVVTSSTPRDRWQVHFLTSTTFSVSGQSSGQQVGTGTIGTPYLVDDDSWGFTVLSGSIPTSAADFWELVTGPYVGNIDPDNDELCQLINGIFTLNIVGGVG